MIPKDRLHLPKICYGPICLKIIKDFTDTFEIKDMPLPSGREDPQQAISKLINIMKMSMLYKSAEKTFEPIVLPPTMFFVDAVGQIARFLVGFADFFSISSYRLPQVDDEPHVFLARILDLMLMALGEEERQKHLDDARAYVNDLPVAIR